MKFLLALSLLIPMTSFAYITQSCIEIQPDMSRLNDTISDMDFGKTERLVSVNFELAQPGAAYFANCPEYVIELDREHNPSTVLELSKMDSAKYCVYATGRSSKSWGYVCRKKAI